MQPRPATVLIGIPTFNRPGLVQDAVRSVIRQTFDNFRVIVSDNASEPAASAIVQRFIEDLADPRVAYFRQPVNRKEYGQGRFLFAQCTEPYFVILHDDDVFEPHYLETALQVLEGDQELAFFAGNQYLFDGQGTVLTDRTAAYDAYQGRTRYPEGRIDRIVEPLLECGLFSISGAVFRRTALERSGFVDDDMDGSYPFEFNVFLRMAEHSLPAYYTPQRLMGYRWHADSMTNVERPQYHHDMLRKLILLLERRRFSGSAERNRKDRLSFNYRNYAVVQYVAGNRAACRQYLWKAVVANPSSWKIWAYVALATICPFFIRPLFQRRVVLAPVR